MHLRKKCILLLLMECSENINRLIWSNGSFKACISLLIFPLDDLTIDVSGVLKFLTITVVLLISLFITVSICLMDWGAPMLEPPFWDFGSFLLSLHIVGCTYIYNCCILFLDWCLDHYVAFFFVSCNNVYIKVYFIWYELWYSNFLLIPICMEYLFPGSLPVCMCP